MYNNNSDVRGIFYGIIGIATLIVAIIGATFAYFTASNSNNNLITGKSASVSISLDVKKVTTADSKYGGIIPMANTMVESALSNRNDLDSDNPKICVDDNGNAVCQIYKITVKNGSSTDMFLDGYVTLMGGAGKANDIDNNSGTTMRWAQAFCTGTDNNLTSCTTVGKTTTGAIGEGIGFTTNWEGITNPSDTTPYNKDQIKYNSDIITSNGIINNKNYDIINTNYIRISDHMLDSSYSRNSDNSSALVYNQYLSQKSSGIVTNTTDSSETLTDSQVYYIVVWLSENGENQSIDKENIDNFYNGQVYFTSSQGSEVTASFSGYTSNK